MDNIIVYLDAGFSSKQKQKIAELLRIHQITTTNNIYCANVVIQPQTMEKNMTIQELATILIKETEIKINDLCDIIKPHKITTLSEIPQNKLEKSYIQPNKKHEQIKQTYKQTVFNRTKHK